MTDTLFEFLNKLDMLPTGIKPEELGGIFKDHMLQALNGKIIDLPMICTNLTSDGELTDDKNVIVIDAGGTNYRCGLASYHEGKCSITNYHEYKMPGTGAPVSWEEFISFLVDTIEPFAKESEAIGFCFSYSAEITKTGDGIVKTIDKEVQITGCEGKVIGDSINEELKKRGFSPKRVIILNDTVAALLGTLPTLRREQYSGFSGMICGTGFNICTSYKGMIYNVEAGFFSSVPSGTIDKKLDAVSERPGEKIIEKLTSGAYIGPLCRELIVEASKEGLVSATTGKNVADAVTFNGAHVSSLSEGGNLDSLCEEKDLPFVKELCDAMLHRSARCVATGILGILELQASEDKKPACICAEGSLISKSKVFKNYLFSTLDETALKTSGKAVEIVIGKDTTLPGAAAAVLLNA